VSDVANPHEWNAFVDEDRHEYAIRRRRRQRFFEPTLRPVAKYGLSRSVQSFLDQLHQLILLVDQLINFRSLGVKECGNTSLL
jgi:hypothetical protein